MPWAKSFKTDEALTKAMNAFWARGYEATSMQDLVDCMGIGRGSLYAAFGDKRRLFLRGKKPREPPATPMLWRTSSGTSVQLSKRKRCGASPPSMRRTVLWAP